MSGLSPSNNVAAEPITLAQARLHLKLDTSGSPPSHPDDTLVTALIAASRESAEKYTGLAIANQTYTLTLDRFPITRNGLIQGSNRMRSQLRLMRVIRTM